MRRALGKGLSQLLGEQFDSSVSEVPIETIVPNARQPRQNFEEGALEELAQSIREVGLLQPLVVRPVGENTYELIAGERRLRASKLAGLATVPVLVRSAGDQSSLEMALVENLQRADISPVESARAFRALLQEFGLTQEQVADKVGKSRTSVANTLRLLRLPTPILTGLEKGEISEGHARALLSVENEAKMMAIYELVVEKGLSVRDTEALTRGPKGHQAPAIPKKNRPGLQTSPEWKQLQEGLSMYFGAPVTLERSQTGGKLSVSFYSDEDLQRILDVLGIHL